MMAGQPTIHDGALDILEQCQRPDPLAPSACMAAALRHGAFRMSRDQRQRYQQHRDVILGLLDHGHLRRAVAMLRTDK